MLITVHFQGETPFPLRSAHCFILSLLRPASFLALCTANRLLRNVGIKHCLNILVTKRCSLLFPAFTTFMFNVCVFIFTHLPLCYMFTAHSLTGGRATQDSPTPLSTPEKVGLIHVISRYIKISQNSSPKIGVKIYLKHCSKNKYPFSF